MRVTINYNNITQKFDVETKADENAEKQLVVSVGSHADALAVRRSLLEEQEPAPLSPDDWAIV